MLLLKNWMPLFCGSIRGGRLEKFLRRLPFRRKPLRDNLLGFWENNLWFFTLPCLPVALRVNNQSRTLQKETENKSLLQNSFFVHSQNQGSRQEETY